MTNQKELTPEEKKEQEREVALKNLKENYLTDLAAAYFVEKTGQYGEAGNSAVEQFKYFPALQNENGSKLITSALLGSRQDGKRYTGNVSEYNIIQNCAKIIQESLGSIKVQDVLELIGSDKIVKEEYKDKYLSELAESEAKEYQETFQKVFGSYIQNLTDTKVSEALGERTNVVKSGLEKVLCGEGEK